MPPGGLARFYRPGVPGFWTFFFPGGGEFAYKKLPGSFVRGWGMVRLGIDWYIISDTSTDSAFWRRFSRREFQVSGFSPLKGSGNYLTEWAIILYFSLLLYCLWLMLGNYQETFETKRNIDYGKILRWCNRGSMGWMIGNFYLGLASMKSMAWKTLQTFFHFFKTVIKVLQCVLSQKWSCIFNWKLTFLLESHSCFPRLHTPLSCLCTLWKALTPIYLDYGITN